MDSQIPTRFPCLPYRICFRYKTICRRALTLSGNLSQRFYNLCTSRLQPRRVSSSVCPLPFRSPLLRQSLFAFSSCSYLDVSVHCTSSLLLILNEWVTGSTCWVPPFGHLDLQHLAPKAFHRLSTSFFGSECQGIHRAPASLTLF